MYNSQAHFFDHPLSFPRKSESNNKSLRNQMVFRMPASAGMTDILNRSVRILSADPRIRGDDKHYWQIRMLIVHNQVKKLVLI